MLLAGPDCVRSGTLMELEAGAGLSVGILSRSYPSRARAAP